MCVNHDGGVGAGRGPGKGGSSPISTRLCCRPFRRDPDGNDTESFSSSSVSMFTTATGWYRSGECLHSTGARGPCDALPGPRPPAGSATMIKSSPRKPVRSASTSTPSPLPRIRGLLASRHFIPVASLDLPIALQFRSLFFHPKRCRNILACEILTCVSDQT